MSKLQDVQQALTALGKGSGAEIVREAGYLAREASGLSAEERASLFRRSTPADFWLEAECLAAEGRQAEAAAALESLQDRDWGEPRALRLLAIARWTKSWRPLRGAAQAAESSRTVTAIDRFAAQLRKSVAFPSQRRVRIGLIGSSTLDLWAPALRTACLAWSIDAEIYTGPFGQYTQEVIDPASGLAAFQPQIVILGTEWHALALEHETEDPDGWIASRLDAFRELWRVCQERFGANVIQHNFEIPEIDPLGALSAREPGGRAQVIARLNLALQTAARASGAVAILDLEQTAGLFGKTRWADAALWESARQYPAAAALPSLARRQAALIRASLGLGSKCAVLDLDNTLWGGIIGEDGLTGIQLGGTPAGESYKAFQGYLRGLRMRGVILAVCSKNNDGDARAPFLEHPEMVLKLDDLALFRATWEPKDRMIREIAEALNIGLDSIVFLDDNPVERNLIRASLPEVEVPELPAEPAEYAAAVQRGMYFEAWSLTGDDRARADAYRANLQRQEVQKAAGNLDEYLASLAMRTELRPFDPANMGRIVQLINKTNQFNLTTRRVTEAECVAWSQDPNVYTQFLRLTDRFGDNGITGILIAFADGGTLRIDNWLMSCRILGRRVEDAMIASALRFAARRGCREVTGDYRPTAKNAQVRDLYERYGFALIEEREDGSRRYARSIADVHEVPEWLGVEDATLGS